MQEEAFVCAASAPGKVLICGGYLIVEKPNVGLSLGVSARFTSAVIEALDNSDHPKKKTVVEVRSPQFGVTFVFEVVHDDVSRDVVTVEQTMGRPSPFLFNGILAATSFLAHFGPLVPKRLTVLLLADNDFYSQRNYLEAQGKHVSAGALRSVPRHNALVGDVSKTGLGSSAALTTSFVACLCAYYAKHETPAHYNDILNRESIHRVAQIAHSIAQGKIGSGFDVYTAVYGTCAYTRFDASRVDALMKNDHQPHTMHPSILWACIKPDVEWVPTPSFDIKGLPRGVHLMLADIHQGGSATPGMVAKIMSWRRQSGTEPGNLWDALAEANVKFIRSILNLSLTMEAQPDAYATALHCLRQLPSAEWSSASDGHAESRALFEALHADAALCRKLLRMVGERAGVDVEPPILTPLLDATLALPGVVAAGCPGAGGYDAIFALVLGDETEMRRVEEFWEHNPLGLNVCPLLVREESRGLTFKL